MLIAFSPSLSVAFDFAQAEWRKRLL